LLAFSALGVVQEHANQEPHERYDDQKFGPHVFLVLLAPSPRRSAEYPRNVKSPDLVVGTVL